MAPAARAKTIGRLLAVLRAYGAERIYLFGSFARGEADELSDADLVVIKRTAASFLDRLREVARLLPPDVGGVDILVYTPEEFATMLAEGNAFAELVAEEGRLVHEQQADGRGDPLVPAGVVRPQGGSLEHRGRLP